jgi:hypothetical protein
MISTYLAVEIVLPIHRFVLPFSLVCDVCLVGEEGASIFVYIHIQYTVMWWVWVPYYGKTGIQVF